MSFNVLSSILRGEWLIEPEHAKASIPLVKSFLSGNFEGLKDDFKQNISFNSSYNARTYKPKKDYDGNLILGFESLPKNSSLVVAISGATMKEDYCGSLGTSSYAYIIQEADKHPNVSSIILSIDSPGGSASGPEALSDAIRNCEKPVLGIVNDGLAASAAYWIASACNELYVTTKKSAVGSIGTVATLQDVNGYYEKQGLTIHTIYAPQSTDKNKDYHDALKGDYKGVKERLKFMTDEFINSVKSNRSGKLNTEKENPFSGKMYFAEEAISIGLIDGIKSMDEVLARAAELSNTKTSNLNNKNTTMSKKTYSAINAVLGVESLETSEEGTFLNEEQLDAVEAGLNERNDMVSQEDHQATVDELASANDSITAANDRLRTVAASVGVEVSEEDTDETIAANIEASFAELQSSSSETTTTVDVDGDDAGEGNDDVFASMSHNQEADNL